MESETFMVKTYKEIEELKQQLDLYKKAVKLLKADVDDGTFGAQIDCINFDFDYYLNQAKGGDGE